MLKSFALSIALTPISSLSIFLNMSAFRLILLFLILGAPGNLLAPPPEIFEHLASHCNYHHTERPGNPSIPDSRLLPGGTAYLDEKFYRIFFSLNPEDPASLTQSNYICPAYRSPENQGRRGSRAPLEDFQLLQINSMDRWELKHWAAPSNPLPLGHFRRHIDGHYCHIEITEYCVRFEQPFKIRVNPYGDNIHNSDLKARLEAIEEIPAGTYYYCYAQYRPRQIPQYGSSQIEDVLALFVHMDPETPIKLKPPELLKPLVTYFLSLEKVLEHYDPEAEARQRERPRFGWY